MRSRVAPLFVGALLIPTSVVGTAAQADDPGAAYAPFLDSLMAAAGVPGLSFALFDSEGVVWTYARGVKSLASGEAVGAGTVFEAASISKPVFALLVEMLAEDGVLDLSRPLVELVEPLPDVAHDARASRLTPAMLLSHQGGLPNWRTRINLEATEFAELFGPGDTLRFVADPGSGYRYSGEGFVLLQRVVEARTGRSLASLAAERIFGPLAMTRTSFSFDAAAEADHAWGHTPDGRPDKWGLRVALASSTLHTTGTDLARFGARLAREIRGGTPLGRMAEPVIAVGEAAGGTASWGSGIGVVDSPAGRYVHHGGNNVIFIADFIYGVAEDLGYVLLTNSANGQAMVPAVEARVFGRAVR